MRRLSVTLILLLAVTSLCCRSAESRAGPTTPGASSGWKLTVYYTAVERFHNAPAQAVIGCLVSECARGSSALGSYPRDFVEAVKDEGTGRITSGVHAGMFLNWSIDIGYWLDSAPRDARGGILEPHVSAAADQAIAFDTRFTVLSCGVDDSTRDPVDAAICRQLLTAPWVVRDRFSNPKVGKHLDLYIGEEDEPGFATRSPKVISTIEATIAMF